jgi:hypothetical protein
MEAYGCKEVQGSWEMQQAVTFSLQQKIKVLKENGIEADAENRTLRSELFASSSKYQQLQIQMENDLQQFLELREQFSDSMKLHGEKDVVIARLQTELAALKAEKGVDLAKPVFLDIVVEASVDANIADTKERLQQEVVALQTQLEAADATIRDQQQSLQVEEQKASGAVRSLALVVTRLHAAEDLIEAQKQTLAANTKSIAAAAERELFSDIIAESKRQDLEAAYVGEQYKRVASAKSVKILEDQNKEEQKLADAWKKAAEGMQQQLYKERAENQQSMEDLHEGFRHLSAESKHWQAMAAGSNAQCQRLHADMCQWRARATGAEQQNRQLLREMQRWEDKAAQVDSRCREPMKEQPHHLQQRGGYQGEGRARYGQRRG